MEFQEKASILLKLASLRIQAVSDAIDVERRLMKICYSI